MKKLVFSLILFVTLTSQAQTNLQLHYDFGKDRHYVTTTLEMFKPDKWGNTFWFVDFDYNFGKENHPSGAYIEIARALKFWNGPISAHVEYNGGLGAGPNGAYAYPINNAWLFGGNYDIHNADFSKTVTFQAMYKHIVGKQESAQLTAVWGLNFFKNKLTLSGFADYWLEDNVNTNGSKTKTTFISEPQFWYNVSPNLSLGSEIELSNNFGLHEGFMVNPTLAAKWNF